MDSPTPQRSHIRFPLFIGQSTITFTCVLIALQIVFIFINPILLFSLVLFITVPRWFTMPRDRKSWEKHRDQIFKHNGYKLISPDSYDQGFIEACASNSPCVNQSKIFRSIYDVPYQDRKVLLAEIPILQPEDSAHNVGVPTVIGIQLSTTFPKAHIRPLQSQEKSPHYRDAHVHRLFENRALECKSPDLILPQLVNMETWFHQPKAKFHKPEIKHITSYRETFTFHDNWMIYECWGRVDHQITQQLVEFLSAFANELEKLTNPSKEQLD